TGEICLSGPLRLQRADPLGLEDRAHRPLHRHGVLRDELAVRGDDAAEVLRPRAVDGAVQHDVSDLPRAEVLRIGREAEERVDLPLGQELLRLRGRIRRPGNVLAGIEADLRGDARGADVLGGPKRADGDGRALEVADRPHPVSSDQLEAADMYAGQDHDGYAFVDGDDERGGEVRADVEGARLVVTGA